VSEPERRRMTAVRLPRSAAIYECQVVHLRVHPVRNYFNYRSYLWLVDLDDLPRIPGLAAFHPADHLGDPRRSIRDNVTAFLAARGIDLADGRVSMLASARVFGHVFNPLSLYWCHRRDGGLECVIAEVHNTYRQRHCYLLRTDDQARAQVGKDFYVSPFHPEDGSYQMTLPEPDRRLAVSIVLRRPGGHSFVASVRGTRQPARPASLARTFARHPWPTAAVTARIRWQGLKLYARGLPVAPRPDHPPQEGA
jgi:DUF1365 family protein